MGEAEGDLVSVQQVRCFCATAQAGSFTAAADELRVSQPAVASQIRSLERFLGVELFTRMGRGVRLTAAGNAFAEHAPAVLRSLSDAVASVSELNALRGGTLALGVCATPAAYRFDRAVSSFCARHPLVTLRLVGRNSSQVADLVRTGDLDAGVVTLPINDDRLDVAPFARDEVLYVSADPRRVREAVTMARLAMAPLVFYDADSADQDPLRRQLIERTQAEGVRLRPRVEVEPIDLALRLVADGVADTYVPRAHTFAAYYPDGLFTTVFAPAVFDTFAVITQRGSRTSPAMQTLLDVVRDNVFDTIESFNR